MLARLRDKKKLLRYAAIAIAVTVAETTPNVDQAAQIAQSLSPILMAMIAVVILVALPLLIFKVLAKSVLEIIRG